MNTWVSDCIPVAGGAYRQLIDDLYRNNRLIKNELLDWRPNSKSHPAAGQFAHHNC